MSVITIAGVVALITSFIGLLPQIIKSLKTKSTQDLSMTMLINYGVCSTAWIVYGAGTESFFVISSNVVGLLVSMILIVVKRYYDAQAH